jgi:hypothetical protein
MSDASADALDTELQYGGRRKERRIQVRLPVEVSGTDRNGARFNERTSSEDVCRQGVAVALSREIDLGASLEIVILMSHRTPQGQDFSTQGLVRHIKKSAAGPIVGVEFIGPHFHRVFQSEAANPA